MKWSKLSKLQKQIIIVLFTSIVVTLILAYRKNFYYFLLQTFRTKTSNPENEKLLKTLHPIFGFKMSKAIKEQEDKGRKVIVTSAYRSCNEQDALNASGATPASCGGSFHNYGLALDLNVDDLRMASSKSSWQEIADEISSYGFRWGGNFSQYDPVHFDFGNEIEMNILKTMAKENKLYKNKYLIV